MGLLRNVGWCITHPNYGATCQVVACELASPWHKTEAQKDGRVGGVLVSYRQTSQIQDHLAMTISKGSGLQGPEGLAGAGGERIIVTRTQEKDSGYCKKIVVRGGGHDIELKTLKFLTENKHRDWKL